MTRNRPKTRALRNRRGITMMLSAVTLLALLGTATLSATAGATAKVVTSHKTVKADTSFFAGKTINWIISTAAGSTEDEEYEVIAPLVGSYLHATVDVSFNGAGGGIPAEDQVASSTPDGLTIGMLSINNTLFADDTDAPSINFSLKNVPYIGATPNPPQYITSCVGSPYLTAKQLIKTKSNVSAVQYIGASDYEMQLFFKAYDIPSHIVQGFANSTTAAAGCLAADGNLEYGAGHFTAQSFKADGGPLTALVLQGTDPTADPLYPILKKVPTIAQLAKEYPPKSKNGLTMLSILESLVGPKSTNLAFFAPQGTPANRVLALTDAFRSAINQPGAKNTINTVGQIATFATPQDIKNVINYGVKEQPVVQKVLGS